MDMNGYQPSRIGGQVKHRRLQLDVCQDMLEYVGCLQEGFHESIFDKDNTL